MRRKSIAVVTVLSAILALASSAWADAIVNSRTYQFLPRLSPLVESGGIVGWVNRYDVFGRLDFQTVPEIYFRPYPLYASFDNVTAAGVHPILDYVVPLDNAFGLSELPGRRVFGTPKGLEVFHFEETIDDGFVDVDVHVATLGPWLFIRGKTEPGCCDFFEYNLKGVARQVRMGDLDGDGEVREHDLTMFERRFGEELDGERVTGRSVLNWLRHYNEVPPTVDEFDAMLNSALAGISAGVVAVPEPTTLGLVLCAGLFGLRRRAISW